MEYSTTLMILERDGSSVRFDVEELHGAIVKAFSRAGNPEVALAEDIALAVEFAMRNAKRNEKLFTRSEIDAVVCRILENAAFAEVARIYAQENSKLDIFAAPELPLLRDLFARHLALAEPLLDKVAHAVADACRSLQIADAAPTLYLELARHYERHACGTFRQDELLTGKASEETAPVERNVEASSFLLTRKAARELASPKALQLLDAGVFRIGAVSRLFPCIRLQISLLKLAQYAKLQSPLTEMVLMAPLFETGSAVGEFCRAVSGAVAANARMEAGSGEAGVKALPIYLNSPDLSEFSAIYLQAKWPDSEETCRALIDEFIAALGEKVQSFKCS